MPKRPSSPAEQERSILQRVPRIFSGEDETAGGEGGYYFSLYNQRFLPIYQIAIKLTAFGRIFCTECRNTHQNYSESKVVALILYLAIGRDQASITAIFILRRLMSDDVDCGTAW